MPSGGYATALLRKGLGVGVVALILVVLVAAFLVRVCLAVAGFGPADPQILTRLVGLAETVEVMAL